MPGRHNRQDTDAEALHEYRERERVERGEKLIGGQAEWLDRRGTAANAALRADAQSRRRKPHDGK